MGFKHAPGCSCCDCWCSSAPSTIDVEVFAFTNLNCSNCADVAGTYTLTKVESFSTVFDSAIDFEDGSCKYEGTFTEPSTGVCPTCAPFYLTLEIGISVSSSERTIQFLFGSEGAAFIEETGFLARADVDTNFEPDDWFTDADCTATLTVDAPGDSFGQSNLIGGCTSTPGFSYQCTAAAAGNSYVVNP